MKVVHVVEALGGGVFTYFSDLSSYFGQPAIAQEVQTTIIYSGNRKTIKPENIESCFSKGVDLVELPMVRNIAPIQDLKATLDLIRKLRRIKPDVIHLHSSKAGLIGRLAQLFLFTKKKVFYSPHGYAFLSTDVSRFTRKLYWFVEWLLQWLFGGETIACGDTEMVIASSIGKSRLVRNGVNIKEIREYAVSHQNKVLTIGIVGRITHARNPAFFNEIALRFPEFEFVWIGDGELRHQITAPNITIKGWITQRAVLLEELNKLDIYLQTSLWEGLPIAVLEAMAMGKPIVATNIIGNKDVVLHRETGFLFERLEELDEIFSFLKQDDHRARFGSKSLERCQTFFDKDKNLSVLLEVYRT